MPTTGERVLLAVLLAACVVHFALALARKIRRVRAGVPDLPRTDRPARRLGRALREVLLQTRTLESRPVVGALHAAVFLGFLLFAFESVDQFARFFGLPLLEPLFGPAYPIYQGAMAVVAAAVAVGILGLAFRRFVLVNSSPDPRSWTSGLVALFILVLMLTYLDGIREAPMAPRANAWVHALVILAFPALILRSKHLHLLLSPATIFLRAERLGQLPTLPLEQMMEDPEAEPRFGLEAMRDVPWKMRLDALTCVECRRCTEACPAARAGSSLDPRGFVLAGRRALVQAADDDAVIGTVIAEDALGACVTCGACEAVCPVGVEHLQVLVGAKRAQALSTGVGLVAGEFFRTMESTGNPLGVPRGERQETIERVGLPPFAADGTSWLLWLGCLWGANPDQRKAVAAFKRLLDEARLPFGVLDEEPCCGHHSRRQGQEAQYQELARATLDALRESGATRIVTPCPHCLHTLKREHGDLEERAPLEIVHHTELLARLSAEGRLPLRAGGERTVATYHDPCYLARFEGIVDAPRALIAAAGATLREMEHHGRRAFCCGGGAAGFVRESKDARIDVQRRADAAATGVPLLVTACPECRMMLDAAVAETRDVAELLAAALPAPDEQPIGEDLLCTP